MHEKGSDKKLVSDKNGFILLTPVGTSKALRMLIRGKVRVNKVLTWALNLKCGSKVTLYLYREFFPGAVWSCSE